MYKQGFVFLFSSVCLLLTIVTSYGQNPVVPPLSAAHLFDKGDRLYRAGNFDEALPFFQVAYQESALPLYSLAIKHCLCAIAMNAGNTAFKSKDYTSAIRYYTEAATRMPEEGAYADAVSRAQAALANTQGKAALLHGDYYTALHAFQFAYGLTADPIYAQNMAQSDAAIDHSEGWKAFQRKDIEEAVFLLKHAVQSASTNKQYQADLATVQEAIAVAQGQRAMHTSDFVQAIKSFTLANSYSNVYKKELEQAKVARSAQLEAQGDQFKMLHQDDQALAIYSEAFIAHASPVLSSKILKLQQNYRLPLP